MNKEPEECECVIMYDSACPQCSWFIRSLNIDFSVNVITSLESEEAMNYYESGEITIDPKLSDTMIVLYQGKQLLYWKALVFCIERSNLPKLLKCLVSVIPNRVGGLLYWLLKSFRNMTRKKSKKCKISFD